MVWLTVNKDGSEYLFSEHPVLKDGKFIPQKFLYHYDDGDVEHYANYIKMPKGSIKKLLGRELTFEESPTLL